MMAVVLMTAGSEISIVQAQSEAARSARDAQIQRQVRSVRQQALGNPSAAAARVDGIRRDLIINEEGVNFDGPATRRAREIRALDNTTQERSRTAATQDAVPVGPDADLGLPSSLTRDQSPLPSMRSQVDRIGSMVGRAERALADGRVAQSRSDLEFSKSFLTQVDPEELDESQREALDDYRERIESLEQDLNGSAEG